MPESSKYEGVFNPFSICQDEQPASSLPFQEKRPEKKSTNPSLSDGNSISQTCPLLATPQEILDQIFGYLIATGHLAIMQTSKAINQLAQPSFTKVAVLKFSFNKRLWRIEGSPHHRVELLPLNINQISPHRVANISVLLDFRNFRPECQECRDVMPNIASYAQTTLQSSLCLMLHNYIDASDLKTKTKSAYYEWLKVGRSFQRVSVAVLSGEKARMLGGCDRYRNYHPRVTRARNREWYKNVQRALEPELGVSTFHRGEEPEDDYLLFKPRAYWGARTDAAVSAY